MQRGLDRADRDLEHGRDLFLWEVLPEPKHDDGTLLRWELGDEFPSVIDLGNRRVPHRTNRNRTSPLTLAHEMDRCVDHRTLEIRLGALDRLEPRSQTRERFLHYFISDRPIERHRRSQTHQTTVMQPEQLGDRIA